MRSFCSLCFAAPHRVMFLPGTLQAVAVMLWWVLDLELRRLGGPGLSVDGMASVSLHAWLITFGLFPFFVFGFLFTAAPNWLNGPAIPRPAYLASAVLMAVGVAWVQLALWSTTLLWLGLALHLAGWGVAVWALLRSVRAAPSQDKRHAAIATAAAIMGLLGLLLFLIGAVAGWPDVLSASVQIGVWGCLMPTFLAVCHRMIPWFTGRIVANYVMIRPYGPLWMLLAGCLAHAALTILGRPEWTWLPDLAMTGIVVWFATRWGVARGVRQVRLLAMLHIAFVWAGLALALFAIDSLAAFSGAVWSLGRAPVHALGIGFFASMLIAMASRVSLGHSGRKLEADGLTWALFWLVQAVAVLRIAPDLLALPQALVTIAGGLWLLVFAVWAWRYAPMYWRARVDGKPG